MTEAHCVECDVIREDDTHPGLWSVPLTLSCALKAPAVPRRNTSCITALCVSGSSMKGMMNQSGRGACLNVCGRQAHLKRAAYGLSLCAGGGLCPVVSLCSLLHVCSRVGASCSIACRPRQSGIPKLRMATPARPARPHRLESAKRSAWELEGTVIFELLVMVCPLRLKSS
jgi:hypothetical protein